MNHFCHFCLVSDCGGSFSIFEDPPSSPVVKALWGTQGSISRGEASWLSLTWLVAVVKKIQKWCIRRLASFKETTKILWIWWWQRKWGCRFCSFFMMMKAIANLWMRFRTTRVSCSCTSLQVFSSEEINQERNSVLNEKTKRANHLLSLERRLKELVGEKNYDLWVPSDWVKERTLSLWWNNMRWEHENFIPQLLPFRTHSGTQSCVGPAAPSWNRLGTQFYLVSRLFLAPHSSS